MSKKQPTKPLTTKPTTISEYQKLIKFVNFLPITAEQRELLRGHLNRTISETVDCIRINEEMWQEIDRETANEHRRGGKKKR